MRRRTYRIEAPAEAPTEFKTHKCAACGAEWECLVREETMLCMEPYKTTCGCCPCSLPYCVQAAQTAFDIP